MLKLCFLCQIVNARSLYWTNGKKLEMFNGWFLLLSLSYLWTFPDWHKRHGKRKAETSKVHQVFTQRILNFDRTYFTHLRC